MPWQLSDQARDANAGATFRYDAGGPWDPANCATQRTPEAERLAQIIRASFSWVHTIGGVRCEQLFDTGRLGIHATGRALDVMVPTLGGDEGTQLADWLVTNAQQLGVQLVIWDGTVWQGNLSEPRARPYTGPNPHIDHVHVEVLEGGGAGGLLHAPGGELSTVAAAGLGVLTGGAILGAGWGIAVLVKRWRRR